MQVCSRDRGPTLNVHVWSLVTDAKRSQEFVELGTNQYRAREACASALTCKFARVYIKQEGLVSLGSKENAVVRRDESLNAAGRCSGKPQNTVADEKIAHPTVLSSPHGDSSKLPKTSICISSKLPVASHWDSQ